MLFTSYIQSVNMFIGFCFATVAVLQYTDAKTTKTKYDDRIIYPGPIQNVSVRYGTDVEEEVPAHCKSRNFCTIKPPNYPQERFNDMFKGYNMIPQPQLIIEDLSDRTKDGTDGCMTTISFEPLYQVRSAEGSWRFVVQVPDKDFVQNVRLEECEEPNAGCFEVYQPDPGVDVFCKQHYNKWRVLVARGNNETEEIEVDLPVCCSCQYRLP